MRHDGMSEKDRINAINDVINNIKMELNGIDGIVDMLDRSINAGYTDVLVEEMAKCLLKATSDVQQLAVEVKYNAERLNLTRNRANKNK